MWALWATASANLTPFAGQSIRILIEAADASGASLVEAAVDNVLITQP
jgi:carboxypeptidase T